MTLVQPQESASAQTEWVRKGLFDLCQFIPGKAHEPFIDPLGEYICVNSKFISTEGQVSKTCNTNITPARKNDILLVMSDLPNGRALGKCFLVDEDDRYAVNQRVCILRPRAGNDPQMLFHLLNRNPYFLSFNDGVNQTHLLNSVFEKCELVVPSAAVEQERVGEALSDADALIEGLERLIAKKRLIKQGARQDLLTAKRRLPGFSGEWSNFRLSEHGKFLSGSGFPLNYQGHTSGDYPFFKVSDFSGEANGVVLTRANHYINADTQKKLGARIFPAGAIAFAKIGAAIFLERKRMLAQNSCLDNNMAAFILQDASLCSDLLLARFQSFALGDLVSSTALPAIASSDLKAIEFYLPKDLEEQKAIARVLADMDAEIQALETRLEKARQVKEGMMQNLLTGRIRLV